jgi:hypothetical protein
MLMLPFMLKKLLGIETVFTASGIYVFNTTFWLVVLGISYLCLDPLVKTAYALRCFYGTAFKSGADILAELKTFRSAAKALVCVLVFGLSLSSVEAPAAEESRISAAELTSIAPERLDQSIEEIMNRREFAWRMPRETTRQTEPESTGFFASAVKWMRDVFKAVFRTVGNWRDMFIDWLKKLFSADDRKADTENKERNWLASLRFYLVFLMILLGVFLAIFFWRTWKGRQRPAAAVAGQAVNAKPDLNDEGISADALSANRWLDLAKELMAEGALRSALRALYLATLAHLAERGLITIAPYKSNREYENELHRRAHDKKDLLTTFARLLNSFERAWYGMQGISRMDVDNYAVDQKRITGLAEG